MISRAVYACDYNFGMAGHQCYHCKQWVEKGDAHDCWTTTEAALTRDLSEDLREAWERLRETAVEFGEQRIYASHKSIMFSRKSCYFFVRPKKNSLEVCVFLRRALKSPRIRRVDQASRSKIYHILDIKHRDEVEAPITDWLREAYDVSDQPAPTRQAVSKKKAPKRTATTKTAAPKPARRAATRKTSPATRRAPRR
jgi:hypothetical protein